MQFSGIQCAHTVVLTLTTTHLQGFFIFQTETLCPLSTLSQALATIILRSVFMNFTLLIASDEDHAVLACLFGSHIFLFIFFPVLVTRIFQL